MTRSWFVGPPHGALVASAFVLQLKGSHSDSVSPRRAVIFLQCCRTPASCLLKNRVWSEMPLPMSSASLPAPFADDDEALPDSAALFFPIMIRDDVHAARPS
jgi:hypothetical protein